jgi:glycerate 2-kinase
LSRLAQLDSADLDKRLANTLIEVTSDVDNPLCGPQGAAVIFGPQKGANPAEVATLDANLTHFADVCARHLLHDHRHAPGAAGGLGFACHAFLKARFRPGVELVAELNGLHEAVQGATLVFTGEGRLDAQTLYGKTPAGVARIAQCRWGSRHRLGGFARPGLRGPA